MGPSSLQMQKAAAWINYQVEREGIARLTILILVLTTVCMLSFTWGYAEGVHNSQSELAEEIRLPAPNKLPSIAELRHTSPDLVHIQQQQEEQQQAAPPPRPTPSDTMPQFDGATAALPTASNLTESSNSQQQQQQPQPQSASAGTDTQQLPATITSTTEVDSNTSSSSSSSSSGSISDGSSDGSGGNSRDSSSSDGDIGLASINSGAIKAAADAVAAAVEAAAAAGSSSILQPHSRAGDGSEDALPTAADSALAGTASEDYGG